MEKSIYTEDKTQISLPPSSCKQHSSSYPPEYLFVRFIARQLAALASVPLYSAHARRCRIKVCGLEESSFAQVMFQEYLP